MTETKKTSIWTKGYVCAFIANVMLCFSQNSVSPLISTYAAYLGAGAVVVGMVSGLYFGVAFAARPISGPAITKMNKKHIMIATYALGVVTNVAYAFCGNIPLFVAARILHGIEFAFVGSLNLTIASDSLPKEKLGSGIGVFGIGGAFATILAPSMGIAVRDWGNALWGNGAGYKAVFILAAVFMLLGLIPCLIIPIKEQTKEALASLGAWYKNIVAKETLIPAIIICCTSVSSVLYSTYMVPYAASKGIENIGLYFTVYAIVLLFSRPLSGRLLDRLGMPKIFYPGCILFIISIIIVALSNTLPMILVGAAFAALGYGALNPALQTTCIRTVLPERRGVASNTNYFGIDLGFFLGPIFGGFIIKYGSYSMMYLIVGIIPVIAAMIIFSLTWKGLKNRLY
jgi:MFS family permease